MTSFTFHASLIQYKPRSQHDRYGSISAKVVDNIIDLVKLFCVMHYDPRGDTYKERMQGYGVLDTCMQCLNLSKP